MAHAEIHVKTEDGYRRFLSGTGSADGQTARRIVGKVFQDVPEDLTEEYVKSSADRICACVLENGFTETGRGNTAFGRPPDGTGFHAVLDPFLNSFYFAEGDSGAERNFIAVEGLYILKRNMTENAAYACAARNFTVGIWHSGAMYYLRRKFGDEYIDCERHWDDGPENFGTCRPLRIISGGLGGKLDNSVFDMNSRHGQITLSDVLYTAESVYMTLHGE